MLHMMGERGVFCSLPWRKKQGVALIGCNPSYSISNTKEIPGRFLKAIIAPSGDRPLTAAVVYAPADSAKERVLFFHRIAPDLADVDLLLGDFNQERGQILSPIHWGDTLALRNIITGVIGGCNGSLLRPTRSTHLWVTVPDSTGYISMSTLTSRPHSARVPSLHRDSAKDSIQQVLTNFAKTRRLRRPFVTDPSRALGTPELLNSYTEKRL